jgi:predicted metal-dependent hydrolase
MASRIQLGDIDVEVIRKRIKNIHLSVYPPTGAVRVSAPERLSLETVRVFVLSKLSWIKKNQRKIREQPRETRREFVDRESHYVWGKRYLLRVEEGDAPAGVRLEPERMILAVRPGMDRLRRQAIVDEWHRSLLREALPALIAKWEPIMGVRVRGCVVRKMKTRWGSCTPRTGRIRINTDLARKPLECLEYILVHEMAHLLEPSHNKRFVALMDQFMPKWRSHRDELNRLPVRHEEWMY